MTAGPSPARQISIFFFFQTFAGRVERRRDAGGDDRHADHQSIPTSSSVSTERSIPDVPAGDARELGARPTGQLVSVAAGAERLLDGAQNQKLTECELLGMKHE